MPSEPRFLSLYPRGEGGLIKFVRACLHISGQVESAGRAAIMALCCLATWLALDRPARGIEEEVYFQSDYQQEVQDEEVLLLQGNVEVHFRDIVIYADEVRLDDRKDEFFGVGNVRMLGEDRDVFADSIWYNYARDEFDMRNARGSLAVQGVGEPVWFRAERLKGSIDNYKMINGRVTTCTPEERREYHLEAGSIKVLPGNKVIFRNGYIFILNVPVLWFPYWAFSLAETPWTVEVGKNRYDGTYVKTKYNYLDEELIIGALLLDYYSRKGWNFGSVHQYYLPRHGRGDIKWNFYYGTYRESDGTVLHANTYSVNLSQALKFGNRFTGTVTFNASSTFAPRQGRTNDVRGSLSANYNAADVRTQFTSNLSATSGATRRSSITSSLSQTRTIFEDVNSTFRFDYSASKSGAVGAAADENLDTTVRFQQNRQGWNWDARIESHWDPDGFTYLGDRGRAYTDKLPEISATFQPNAFPARYRNWLGFQMERLTLLGALYYIGPEKSEIQGFFGRLETSFRRNWDLGRSHKFNSTASYWQGIASTGDAQYSYRTQVNWDWDITKKLSSRMGWSRSDEEGRIPFKNVGGGGSPSNQLSYDLRFQNGRLYNVQLGTSYILRERYALAQGELLSIKRLQQISLQFTYTPHQSTTVRISTGYDAANDDWKAVTASVGLTDNSSYRLQSSLSLNPKGGSLQRLSIQTFTVTSDLALGEDWDVHIEGDLSPAQGQDYLRKLQAIYRLDCTFLSFQYVSQNDQWSITWGVTAYPAAHLGYSTTEEAFGPELFNVFQGTGGGFNLPGFTFGG